jgi:hypothetical protein
MARETAKNFPTTNARPDSLRWPSALIDQIFEFHHVTLKPRKGTHVIDQGGFAVDREMSVVRTSYSDC